MKSSRVMFSAKLSLRHKLPPPASRAFDIAHLSILQRRLCVVYSSASVEHVLLLLLSASVLWGSLLMRLLLVRLLPASWQLCALFSMLPFVYLSLSWSLFSSRDLLCSTLSKQLSHYSLPAYLGT